MVLRVRDVSVHPVILLVEGDSGGPFQGKDPPPSQGRKSALAVRFAVGPVRVEANDPGVGGKE